MELARKGLLGMSFTDASSDKFRTDSCIICQQHKLPRRPKNRHSPRGTRPGELVHCDISGPFVASKLGNDHIISMLDDYSKICSIMPMVGKISAFDKVCEFVATLERQVGERVRFIRSDNGGEFTSNVAEEWYRKTGIIHQISTPYTPELNGTIERFMRTSKEMLSTMVAEGNLGHDYWDYAAKYSSTILMKTTDAVDGVNAWFRLTGRDPNVASILRFGAPVFVHLPKETRRKANFEQQKATSGVILGQDEFSSGWIVKIDSSDKIVRSRDVRSASGKKIDKKTNDEPDKRILPLIPQEEEEEIINSMPVGNAGVGWDELPGSETVSVSSPPAQAGGGIKESVKPSWYYEEIDDTESNDAPQNMTATFEGGIRRNAPRATRSHPSAFLSYVGPNARNAYLATEACVLLTAFDHHEPNTIEEAMSGPDKAQWDKAIQTELQNLKSKDTWELTKAPKNRNVIGCRWVFKLKRDADGRVQKYKARLVAKGFSQVPGVDFEETYAPVGRTTSLRLLLAIAATEDLEIYQVDVEGAYLNGSLEEEIYMSLPPPMKKNGKHDCVKLKKSLYGLKQSGRAWWKELSDKFQRLGFKRLESDWGLYIRDKTERNNMIMVLVYVDDLVITARNKNDITKLIQQLSGFWKLSVIGEVNTILGMKVTRDRTKKKAWLSQPAYIDQVLTRFTSRQQTRPKSTPLPKLTSGTNDSPTSLTRYQEIIGCLQWLSTCTRPDIAFAAAYLARFASNPLEQHWELALRVASYLSGTRNQGLQFGSIKPKPLVGWVDADWAGCYDTRKSTTGYIFMLNDSPIIWKSRRQQTVASSTVESEYIAVSEAGREAVWLRGLLHELSPDHSPATEMKVDNQGAIRLAINPSTHQRTKHIDIKHHHIRQLIEDKIIKLTYVPTNDQLADILTKPLTTPRHIEITCKIMFKVPSFEGEC